MFPVFKSFRKLSSWPKSKSKKWSMGSRRNYFMAGCFILMFFLIGLYRDYQADVRRVVSLSYLSDYHQNESDPCSKQSFNMTRCQALKDRRLLEEMKALYNARLFSPNATIPTNSSQTCRNNNASWCTNPCKLSPYLIDRLENLLFSPQLQLSDQQRADIISVGKNIKENDVIIVSAASSNHYDEMQAMFQNLHTKILPHHPNLSLVLFDIGLTPYERNMTVKNCKCQVITFPVEKFPSHVRLNFCYAFKPIIVLAAIQKARKILIWQDTSIRWVKDFQFYLDKAEKYGQHFARNYWRLNPISSRTLKQTFDYMEEKPCAFTPYTEVPSGMMLHKNDPLVIRAHLEPWARCALEPSCICPGDPCTILPCHEKKKLHSCHRFDQSAMGVLLYKLYNQDFDKMFSYLIRNNTFMRAQRGHIAKTYFKP